MVMVKNYIYIATKIENKFLNFELVQEMRWGEGGGGGGRRTFITFTPRLCMGTKIISTKLQHY